MLKIQMLPVRHGDCLLIEYGDPGASHRVLIDAGPYYAFEDVTQRIDALADSGLTFKLFVITHVDTDHIDGAIKLLGARPEGISFDDIWYNGWMHLSPERYRSPEPEDRLGPVHGEMLSALIDTHNLPWNCAFDGRAARVTSDGSLPVVTLDGDLTLTLISPTQEELSKLEDVWPEQVRRYGFEPGSREEALEKLRKDARRRPPPDRLGGGRPDIPSLAKERFKEHVTETNASSIAFLAEHRGKSCLFAADAQPYVLEKTVQRLLAERGETRLQIDAVKVSHHGSRGNTSPALLRLLSCKHFLISTDGSGSSNHPHAETLARIVQECGPGVELWFNYRSDETKIWDDAYLKRRHEYQTHYPKEGEEGITVPLSNL